MKNFLTSIFIIIFSAGLFAQTKPDFFPEDLQLESTDKQIRCYCKPGVRYNSPAKGIELSYGLVGAGVYEPEGDTGPFTQPYSEIDRWQQIEFKIKTPIILREKLKILIGYKYYSEVISFKTIGEDYKTVFQNLDSQPLKRNAFSIIVNKPLNETSYLVFRGRYLSNGNYKEWLKVGKDYSIYNFIGLYAFKPNEDFEWGIGLNITKSFRKTALIPFLIYNKTFNDNWGVESVLPAYIYGRYNINDKNVLLFGVEYQSGSYRMKFEDEAQQPFDFALNHSELLSLIRLEHGFSDWVWGSLKFGYQTNFSSDFESKISSQPSFFVEPTDGLYFQVGVFISPPAKASE